MRGLSARKAYAQHITHMIDQPSADSTALRKRVASDASYIAVLESGLQTQRAAIRGIFLFFLAMFFIITIVLWIPGHARRDAATLET